MFKRLCANREASLPPAPGCISIRQGRCAKGCVGIRDCFNASAETCSDFDVDAMSLSARDRSSLSVEASFSRALKLI